MTSFTLNECVESRFIQIDNNSLSTVSLSAQTKHWNICVFHTGGFWWCHKPPLPHGPALHTLVATLTEPLTYPKRILFSFSTCVSVWQIHSRIGWWAFPDYFPSDFTLGTHLNAIRVTEAPSEQGCYFCDIFTKLFTSRSPLSRNLSSILFAFVNAAKIHNNNNNHWSPNWADYFVVFLQTT